MATKSLNFYARGLQKDITITLVFNPVNTITLFKSQFPVIWKVITFRAGEGSKASIQYNHRLAFGYAQIGQDNLVNSTPWVEVEGGDVTTLSGGPGERQFGENTRDDKSKLLVCKNETGDRVDLSLGFVKGNGTHHSYTPTFVWTDLDAGAERQGYFIPMLSAYVTSDYKETELLRGDIETEAIWTRNMDDLDYATGWDLVEDRATGGFSIVETTSV